MSKPTKVEIIGYAIEGLCSLIGFHRGNPYADEDIPVWESHLEYLNAELAKVEKRTDVAIGVKP